MTPHHCPSSFDPAFATGLRPEASTGAGLYDPTLPSALTSTPTPSAARSLE